jgi:two-component system response regulator YesN
MYAYYAAIRNGTGRDIMIKLLIVDDEPLVQIGIKSMLRWDELGIEVCGTAMNGKAALEMIRQYRPDIVITDIKMPVMNGLELVKICRDEFGPIPLFIILTSFEEFSLIKEAMSYQAVDYLIKLELDPGSLKSSIEKASERLEELKAKESFRQNQGRPTLLSYMINFSCVFFITFLKTGISFPFSPGIWDWIFLPDSIWPVTASC